MKNREIVSGGKRMLQTPEILDRGFRWSPTRPTLNGTLQTLAALGILAGINLLVATNSVAAAAPDLIDFDNQVIPVLTKAGCNTGACHGAAAGRGGLRLSLYGGDPSFDYRSIANELEGRRVNLAEPGDSLLILKPTETLEHGGGYRLEFDGEGVDVLTGWVSQGAKRIATTTLTRLDVTPKQHVFGNIGEPKQLVSTATFADGSTKDVTTWTVFSPEDASSVRIDGKSAIAEVLRAGRHVVVARYLDQVVAIELIVPISDQLVSLDKQPRVNFIDDHVLARLALLRIPLSPVANDETFLRRVTLDLTGRLPKTDRLDRYNADRSPSKRSSYIDELLESEEFTEYWTHRWATLLRIRSQPTDETGLSIYHDWLKRQVAANRPFDQVAIELLNSLGDTHELGPPNFYRTTGGPRQQAEFVSELFMGSRLRCANCHNHPLDKWTQDDYHGLAAVFAKLSRGRVIDLQREGEVIHPRTGESAVPRIPGERFLTPSADAENQTDNGPSPDARRDFSAWLTDRQNPYFAKATVNRLWKAMMGRGLVEPTDDLRATNPATHPELLTALANDFIEHGYDVRHVLKRIALSHAYGRSSTPTAGNQADDRFYSHSLSRPLLAEVLADAIADVLEASEKYGDTPLGTRAIALTNPKTASVSLDILGRCSREESCENDGNVSGGLTTKLHLMNGALLNERISAASGRLGKLRSQGMTSDEIITQFYRAALGRSMLAAERDYWRRQLGPADDKDTEQVLEDFVWSLMTCREFTTNH